MPPIPRDAMRVVAFLFLLFVPLAAFAGETINVAADVSLKEAMIDMGAAFQDEAGVEVVSSFGATGALADQARKGGTFDVLILADGDAVAALAKDKVAIDRTARIVCGNKLVLVVPAASKLAAKSPADLGGDDVKRIAIGDAKIEPAGVFAMQWLQYLKLDQSLSPKLVPSGAVRQVLDEVERGHVDAGFVYQTDAEQAGLRVKKLFDAPPEAYGPVLYSGVVLTASKHAKAAEQFLDFMATKRGRWILEKRRGFIPDPPTTRPTTSPSTQPATKPGD
jgi:molybdate transport system substrate-binding protein